MIRSIRAASQRGQVLVMFGLSAVALFAIAALAIDGGRVLMDQRALQNAADGGALTGAADIGPSIPAANSSDAKDDVVYAVEQALNISFSNNYPGVNHRLVGGNTCAQQPDACQPPYSSTCCTNWADNTNGYFLTIQTPYNWNGQPDMEAYLHIRLVHQLPLLIGGSLYPTLGVTVDSYARNYALNYSIFTFKHNDPNDYNSNGNASLSTDQSIGTNGSANSHQGFAFTCAQTPPATGLWGGDLWSFTTPPLGPISGVGSGGCPSGPPAATNKLFSWYQLPPPLHLPGDPCLETPPPSSPNCSGLAGSISVTGTQMLQPTRSSVPGQPIGPRYSLVTVASGATLYLQPGVYYFEGTGAATDAMGLQILGGSVLTGDCWNQPAPCTTPNGGYQYSNPAGICQPATQLTLALGGSLSPFHCTASGDFGVLLVFWPAGPAVDPACVSQSIVKGATTYYYCQDQISSAAPPGSVNRLHVQSGASIFLSSSPMYHNVSVYVDWRHATSAYNFTDSATVPACVGTSLTAQQCARVEGNGAAVIYIQGGGTISILGAIVGPTATMFVGGASAGKGFGQMLIYLLHYQGNAVITENFNPIALAYSPVLIQ